MYKKMYIGSGFFYVLSFGFGVAYNIMLKRYIIVGVYCFSFLYMYGCALERESYKIIYPCILLMRVFHTTRLTALPTSKLRGNLYLINRRGIQCTESALSYFPLKWSLVGEHNIKANYLRCLCDIDTGCELSFARSSFELLLKNNSLYEFALHTCIYNFIKYSSRINL